LRIASAGDDNGAGTVSPQAATVPLTDDTRATDGLAADDPRRAAPDTARVNRAELDAILRTRTPTPAGDGEATLIQSEQYSTIDLRHGDADASTNTSEIRQATAPPDSLGLVTRHGLDSEFDDELTISVPRVSRPFDTGELPVRVEPLDGTHAAHTYEGEETIIAQPVSPPASPAPTTNAPPRRRWPFVVGACAALLLITAGGAWLASTFWRKPAPTEVSSVPPTAPPDAKQLFEEKMAQAETLLASGDMDGAVARLREANSLDPSNTRAHRRLGEILLDRGARPEAIAEFRAVVQNSPDDFTAWRALAAAQFAEGMHQEAAESYRRLVALVGENAADPSDLLSYADALRLSGRADEARTIYQRVASAPSAEVAALARQRLDELVTPAPTPTPTPRVSDAERPHGEEHEEATNASPGANVPAPVPTPQTPAPTPAPTQQPRPSDAPSSPADRYRRGVELWSSNRGAAIREFIVAAQSGNPDAHYYLGLNLVEGKDMRSLKRAEVVAALQYFQLAQRGQFAAPARRYAQQLEKEFDRLQRQR
jgi:tetratricopeptide (TPR) repeat protein